MAVSLLSQNVLDMIVDIYPMKIYTDDANLDEATILPCDIMDLNISSEDNLPLHPVDTNTLIVDTIYRGPVQITARVKVDITHVSTFDYLMEDTQYSDKYFMIKGRDGQLYSHLKYSSISHIVDTESTSCYFYDIAFTRIETVHSEVAEVVSPSAAPTLKPPKKYGTKPVKKDPPVKQKERASDFYKIGRFFGFWG